MTKRTLYILGLLLTWLLGAFLYWKLCCSACTLSKDDAQEVTQKTKETTIKPVVEKPIKKDLTLSPFSIKDPNGNFEYHSNDNFNFSPSSFSLLEPLSSGVIDGVDKIKAYLEGNSSKIIDVTGYYNSDETNNSAYPNLGIARATSVKNYLVSNGISSRQINTKGELKDALVKKDSIYIGPLEFGISTSNEESAKAEADALKALGDKIKENPLVLYFKTGQAAINLTAEQRQKIANISNYLDKAEGGLCLVTGHTDNTGNRTTNIRLGQERADFAKNYLVKNGIPENKINATSKGPDAPIADNGTEEGRAKNRRTVITIN